ncbi:MAG: hypothetical protein CMN87_06025 [Stappia sp.]|uniref:hypothetical protein n=1 Tax=Stappia sp. TaxID=1870903 RepID=UPI000C46BABF|nr:hypothetical protein [Stappia sp.]MAA99378.1 hypothetical protein [Stappia sp.]MBM19546.1 hypothetical protein [Stappia sp.]
MIRLFLIAICAVIVVVVGIVVWNVTTEPEAPAAAVAPDRQHYDLEGGQEMRPRWGRNEGGADGTSGN